MKNSAVKLVTDNTRETPRERQLPMILSISKEMLKRAKNNDWEQVIVLESQRNILILDYFSIPVSNQEALEVSNYINKVLDIDRQLIELGDQDCDHLKSNLQKINHGKHALKLYTSD
jgi:hypothetical protein